MTVAYSGAALALLDEPAAGLALRHAPTAQAETRSERRVRQLSCGRCRLLMRPRGAAASRMGETGWRLLRVTARQGATSLLEMRRADAEDRGLQGFLSVKNPDVMLDRAFDMR
jgi:hypothetical protein